MFILARAVTYASCFVGLLLVFLPSRILSSTGIVGPTTFGMWQLAGTLLGAAGAALVLACILTFVFVGKGTAAPFDPPRRLVIRGPYRFARNPIYIGAISVLAGATLYYGSRALLVYTAASFLGAHLLVVLYEEPTLRRTFGREYEAYCQRVGRWWPVRRRRVRVT